MTSNIRPVLEEMFAERNVLQNLKTFSEFCHERAKTWWVDPVTGEFGRPWSECMALLHSEVSEALEGARKDSMDDKLPHRKMYEVELGDALIRLGDSIRGFRIIENWDQPSAYLHMQDARALSSSMRPTCMLARVHSLVTRVHDRGLTHHQMAETAAIQLVYMIIEVNRLLGLDIPGATDEKMEYNLHRADHKIENRLAAGGKKC